MILVFYFDREVMNNMEIMDVIIKGINQSIDKDNVRAFIMPTDEAERVECINPVLATKEEKGKIKTLISKLESEFDMQKELPEESMDESKSDGNSASFG